MSSSPIWNRIQGNWKQIVGSVKDEFPPLRGLKHFFCIFLLFHLLGGAQKMEK